MYTIDLDRPVDEEVITYPQEASKASDNNTSIHSAEVSRWEAFSDDLSAQISNADSIDPIAEKKLVRKCDWHVLPMLSILYLLAFIGRINMGNVRLEGLEKDLGMKGNDFNIALFIFFIPYILLEVPSNICLRRFSPSNWLSGLMFMWGIVTIGEGFVHSFRAFVVCRFFLGVFEAGLVPGCIYVVSMWFQRYELQWRITMFYYFSLVAGATGGLLAHALANMSGIRGYSGWRWIYIVEGVITVLVAIGAKWFVVDWPETCTFLSIDEHAMLIRRLRKDAGHARLETLNEKSASRIFHDWKLYCGIFMYMGCVVTGYSVSFFTPTILHQLGWTAVHAQVMSIPIYAAAGCIGLVIALLTDRFQHRYGFAMLGVLVATSGYIILLRQHSVSVGVRYAALFLCATGAYIVQPITIVWLNNNMGGHYKRGIAAGMQIGFGNIGGIVASNVYLSSQAPDFPLGYSISLAMMWLCGIACTVFFVGIWRENRHRDRGGRDYRYEYAQEIVDNLGDDHPRFRYGL